MNIFMNLKDVYCLVTPFSHDAHKIMCVIYEGHTDHRDHSLGWTLSSTQDSSMASKYADKIPNYWRYDHFWRVQTLISTSLKIYPKKRKT